ncbi:signal transduction histidine kinase, nitrogen specific, NtrB [Neobacillus bataviensis LMG 21833]|uniref:histidine kinase n=1 Tax=Neobacillus bataviensis LMG 21833 TaxID=1117379 RepID=K6DC50_9BACI|nr:ATP-binding protein [Neobacillus bataviensis]EKN70102.1 signal transduction histidine kinase, nitrogen specific, NtrB [Neobacillus bataviensis LMG 21833]
MNRSGQIILVFISIAFTTFQKIWDQHAFFTLDFFIFTSIAWVVGWQYDKARYFEKKARSSEESYKQLIDSLPEPVYITRNHQFLYANNAASSMIGAANKEDIIGLNLFDFIVPEYNERMLERFKQIKKEKKPVSTIEYNAKRLDGSTFFFEVTSLFIMFGGSEAILSIGKDITNRKEETARLLQKSEKLALLGQMAAGIAHEIRNPLTSIKGFIQLFKVSQQKEEYFDIVLAELERINAIVGEFLVLAKPTAAVYVEQDVKVLIKDVITLMSTQSILNSVEIFVDYDHDLPMISCEENQLKQVFLNLLKNAMESMPHGGNIHIIVLKKEEGTISIKIIDQGIGIPEERISTLGEPFYTTKEKGTGLGLMTCYKIIEGHNGVLTIHSTVNKGTTIEIILPTITQPLLKKEVILV